MSGRRHLPHGRRVWVLILLVVVLLAGHGAMLYFVSSHLMVPAAILAGVVAVVAVKHLELLGPLYALLRRHRSRRKP